MRKEKDVAATGGVAATKSADTTADEFEKKVKAPPFISLSGVQRFPQQPARSPSQSQRRSFSA